MLLLPVGLACPLCCIWKKQLLGIFYRRKFWRRCSISCGLQPACRWGKWFVCFDTSSSVWHELKGKPVTWSDKRATHAELVAFQYFFVQCPSLVFHLFGAFVYLLKGTRKIRLIGWRNCMLCFLSYPQEILERLVLLSALEIHQLVVFA